MSVRVGPRREPRSPMRWQSRHLLRSTRARPFATAARGPESCVALWPVVATMGTTPVTAAIAATAARQENTRVIADEPIIGPPQLSALSFQLSAGLRLGGDSGCNSK